MSSYKIENKKWVEKGNSGGGKNFDKGKLIKEIEKEKENLKKLKNQFSNLEKIEGEYIFSIKYNNLIPPKTKRIVFNLSTPKDLEEIRQKTLITKNDKSTLIFYQIKSEEYDNFLKKVNNLIKMENLNNEMEKIFMQLKEIDSISQNHILPTKIEGIKGFKLIYIKKYIDFLKKEKILRKDNFNEELLIGFLDNDEYDYILKNYSFLLVEELIENNLFSNELELPTNNFEIKLENNNEITIGVIDSGIKFNDEFKKFVKKSEDWREFKNFKDVKHGNAVLSLIIGNDELNPGNKDELGNFNIKHFEVLEPYYQEEQPQVSFKWIIRILEDIIIKNQDIKVWNMSLGGIKEPYSITISKIGQFLDLLSYKHNILFVVSAGNSKGKVTNILESLCAPAE